MSYSLNSFLIPTPNVFVPLNDDLMNENNNNHLMVDENDKIQEIWNKHTFRTEKVEQVFDINDMKVRSWMSDNLHMDNVKQPEKSTEEPEPEDELPLETVETKEEQNGSPSHHARRPMNAFLIFCKKHRPIVRDRYPNLENRGVTKILGEWWSLLEERDKTPFTNLASEYKDAFLSANPDFKWYKLPAPPLRTLFVRPPNPVPKLPSPQLSPSQTSLQIFNEFTPGKLADESQLGSITSLLNNNFSGCRVADCYENDRNTSSTIENNNKTEQCDTTIQSPVNLMKPASLPPKPIKKRIFQQYTDNSNAKEVSRNILNSECNENYAYFQAENQTFGDSMTNQDIVDKVVDNLFTKKIDSNNTSQADEKTRKSGRQCKGKRYEKFMVEGKLLGNKKDRLTQNKDSLFEKSVPERKLETITPNLENTIKRLAERTKIVLPQNDDEYNNVVATTKTEEKEDFCGSETSESCPGANFNLDLKITNLPSLSYEAFVQKKRDSKKRKMRRTTCENAKNSPKTTTTTTVKDESSTLVGSKKRKNKHSITHLGKKEEKSDFNDLLGLATLAEVAANTQKINEA